jgi:hypothetical protein
VTLSCAITQSWHKFAKFVLCVELSFVAVVLWNTFLPGSVEIINPLYIVIAAAAAGLIMFFVYSQFGGIIVTAACVIIVFLFLIIGRDKFSNWVSANFGDGPTDTLLAAMFVACILLLLLSYVFLASLTSVWRLLSSVIMGLALGLALVVLVLEIPFPSTTDIDLFNTSDLSFWIQMVASLQFYLIVAYRHVFFPCAYKEQQITILPSVIIPVLRGPSAASEPAPLPSPAAEYSGKAPLVVRPITSSTSAYQRTEGCPRHSLSPPPLCGCSSRDPLHCRGCCLDQQQQSLMCLHSVSLMEEEP